MSILYCILYFFKDKQILAESSKGKKYLGELQNIQSEIFSKTTSDQISIDNKNLFTYKKYKEVVIVVVSSKSVNKNQPLLFIDELKRNIESEHKSIKSLLDQINKNIQDYCLQEFLGKTIDNTIKFFNSDFAESLKNISELNKEVESIKDSMIENVNKQVNNLQDLEKPLIKAQEIKNLANDFRRNADETLDKTKCWCSRKMKIIYFVLLGLVILFLIYMIIALSLCGNFNAFCGKN